MPSPAFKIADAFAFAVSRGLAAEANAVRSMSVHPSIQKSHVVRKGGYVELLQSRGLFDEFVANYWPGYSTAAGQRRCATYLDQKALNDKLLRGEPPDEDAVGVLSSPRDDDSVQGENASFALEGQLRDFIAQNLSNIDVSGRRLTLYVDGSGRDGVEYPTDVGPIDILAVDDRGSFVIFELKLERGPDRALGQLARYMGWVKVNLAAEREVSGVVVAKAINDRLRYAVCVMPNVSLLEYEVQFQLRGVAPMSSAQPNPQLQRTSGTDASVSK